MTIKYDVYDELDLERLYTPWGSATYNYNLIVKSGRLLDFINDITESFPNGLELIELNDILWFDDEYCYQFVNDEYLDENELEIKRSY